MNMIKKSLDQGRRFLLIAVTVLLLALCAGPVRAAEAVDYLDADNAAARCDVYTVIRSADSLTLDGDTTGGWYVVDTADVTVTNRIEVSGSVHLILRDGASLTAQGGIHVKNGDSLTIYGQEKGTGTLTAGYSSSSSAAIGGNNKEDAGSIRICGGTVTAGHGDDAAAIGGGEDGAGGIITITGGTVTATGKDGAAIGGGQDGDSGTITITGGNVTANSSGGAGIGAGEWDGNGNTILITGGTVNATSNDGAGIGGGHGSSDQNGGNGGNITIDGGNVTATSTEGAGIGGGDAFDCTSCGNGGNVTINGGTVKATSTTGAGIGGGHSDWSSSNCGNGGVVTINGGAVIAKSATAAGIGGGRTGSNDNCGGGAEITLGWTKVSDSITVETESDAALAYHTKDGGAVTLKKPFFYENTTTAVSVADFADNAKVNGKTLVPGGYTVSVTVTPAAAGVVSGDGDYVKNETAKLTASANDGYVFDGWYDLDGKQISAEKTYSFTVTENVALTARFHAVYPITVTYDENGSADASAATATANTPVTITVKPNDGFDLATLTATAGSGEVPLTKNEDGTYGFTMPESAVAVNATFKACPSHHFTDVDQKAWYHEYVDYVIAKGLMRGVTATTFEPETATSRAMLVMTLYRLAGEQEISGKSPFKDVKDNSWYGKAVIWAYENKIVDGYGGGLFGPDDPVTREQLVTIFYRYSQFKGYDVKARGDLTKFKDENEISAYAKEAMSWAVAVGLVEGMGDGTVAPKADSTRAQIAAILTRFCETMQ